MSLAEIEKAIAKLPPEELSKFTQWFEEYQAERWDKQIEQDVKAGRLDHLIREADEPQLA